MGRNPAHAERPATRHADQRRVRRVYPWRSAPDAVAAATQLPLTPSPVVRWRGPTIWHAIVISFIVTDQRRERWQAAIICSLCKTRPYKQPVNWSCVCSPYSSWHLRATLEMDHPHFQNTQVRRLINRTQSSLYSYKWLGRLSFLTDLLWLLCLINRKYQRRRRKSLYRAMHYSAKRGIAIACRPSVCL